MARTLLLTFTVVAVCSCAMGHRELSVARAELASAVPLPPRPLERSLFASRGESGLTEADIGRILDSPLDMRTPARVGIAALGEAFQPISPSRLGAGLVATGALADALEGSKLVTVASEIATEIPTGGGVEGLRELAARYRAPYLLLYTERFEDRTHANGLAALWVTILGGLLTPSQTLRADGVLSVSLLDVRTGTVLFTVREAVAFEEMHLPVGAAAAYRDLQRKAADKASKALAAKVLEKFQRLARAAEPTEPEAAAQGPVDPEQTALRLAERPEGLLID
jgi:hypothetical protein